jgi:cytochrome c biogenesis protein CcmG/thiol:disulfide interchange protein DsbE
MRRIPSVLSPSAALRFSAALRLSAGLRLAAACAPALCSLGVLSALACNPPGVSAGAATLPPSDHPLAGSPAPDFSLVSRQGDKAQLSAHSGRVVLVDFWATWCEPCKESFPQYQALTARYGDAVVVLGISEDDEADGIDRFTAETGAHFPVAWDADKSVAQRYRIGSMPMLFIIDGNGLVRFVHSGFRPGDQEQIAAAIDSLL